MGNTKLFLLFTLFFLMLTLPAHTQVFQFQNSDLKTVIKSIEAETSYLFLYREAQVAGIRVSFQSSEDSVITKLKNKLKPHRLRLKVQEQRKQIIIYQATKEKSSTTSVKGIIVDDETGERLSYATISWENNGARTGIAADLHGQFELLMDSEYAPWEIDVSYLGYRQKSLLLEENDLSDITTLTIRLEPLSYAGKEIIVHGSNFYTPSDTVFRGLLKTGSFSPLGESNSVRTLQTLPSVTAGPALNNGINVRGSSSDGFRVLLDGMSLYNQQHLFGLLDAMNADVLRTSSFHYDIAPAQYQSSLGGTLSLVTRTGSLNEFRGTTGISNTAVNTTLEAPLIKGKSSWLISGRYSFMEELDWFGNRDLIQFGLDVDRPYSINELILPGNSSGNFRFSDPQILQSNVTQTEALFYDLHAKTYFETRNGEQFIISGYLGEDDTRQAYSRPELNESVLFETNNSWKTEMISGSYNSPSLFGMISGSSVGYSAYSSSFLKDDFLYQVRGNENRQTPDTVLISPLYLQNELSDFTIQHTFSEKTNNVDLSFGFSYHNFVLKYEEQSLPEASFRSRRTSQLTDVFLQADMELIPEINLAAGSRVHYFSNGEYLRWSPRLKLQLFPDAPVSADLGFSKNHQFLHRLQFYNINSTDMWIMSNVDQPPSSVDYYTSALRWNPGTFLYIQIEGYYKYFRNLRLHQLNTGLISNTFTNEDTPWFYNNTGRGKGLEFLIRNNFHPVAFTTTYTLSYIEIENPMLNNGEAFYPEWDRRHQLGFVSEINITRNFEAFLAFTYATGTPGVTDLRAVNDQERLEDFFRTDIHFKWQTSIDKSRLEASFSIYNLFDRQNPWYKEIVPVTVTRRAIGNNPERDRRLTAEVVFQDLGFQPSFNLSLYF